MRVLVVVVVLVGTSSMTTSLTNASTFPSIVLWSAVVAQPPLCSARDQLCANFASALLRQEESAGMPTFAPLAWQRSLA